LIVTAVAIAPPQTSPSDVRNLETRLAAALTQHGRWFPAVAGALALVVLWGVYAWVVQLRAGLVVTGLHDRMPWGLYISTFVFLIGASYGGTLTSSILRLTGANWRRPIVRLAEASTVALLLVGALMPLVDLGRPDQIMNLLRYGPGRLSSPVMWDVLAVGTYLAASLLYLYVSLIPDLALLRDRIGTAAPRWQRGLYRALALGWRGTDAQHALLHKAIATMAVLIIPVAVMAHTALSFIFSMTLRPGWHSTIFGPYFVVGAIFSGVGAIIIAMAIFRRVYHLEPWITLEHFRKLGLLMLVLALIYLYFTAADYHTIGYHGRGEEAVLLDMLYFGAYAPMFWLFVVAGLLVPILLLALPWTRTIAGITTAAVLVNIGMWLKRFIIVVPSQAVPQTPLDAPTQVIIYQPTWVEWSVMAGSFAGVALIFLLFCRLFPIISIWEVAEDEASGEALPAGIAARRPAPSTIPAIPVPAPTPVRPAFVPSGAMFQQGGQSGD
jgi:Ni/Fe-hydrogenase subunit HybB-like protein